MVSHAILGATLAYINGGDPTAGGSAAVASEAAATYFTHQYDDGKTAIDPLTGEFNPNLLSEDVKTQIRDLTAGIGAVIGGVAGDSTYNAQLAGVIGQNAVENNVYGVLDKNKNVIKDRNTLTAQALQACTQVQCVNMVLTNNAKDAMVNAPQIILLNGNNYKEGQIVSSPNNGSGLQYLVVKENGVLKAKLLPLNYQVINSIKDFNTGRAISTSDALAAPLANLVVGLHDSSTGTSLLTNEQLSVVDRTFAALDAAGSFGVLTGAFLPKGVKTTGNSQTKIENNVYRDDSQKYDKYRENYAKDWRTGKPLNGGNWNWGKEAPNDGAVIGSQRVESVKVNDVLDRYGSEGGAYMAPANVPLNQRSLPPGKNRPGDLHTYIVKKKFDTLVEDISPAFGQPGGGTQIRAKIPEVKDGFASIEQLKKFEYLEDKR